MAGRDSPSHHSGTPTCFVEERENNHIIYSLVVPLDRHKRCYDTWHTASDQHVAVFIEMSQTCRRVLWSLLQGVPAFFSHSAHLPRFWFFFFFFGGKLRVSKAGNPTQLTGPHNNGPRREVGRTSPSGEAAAQRR